MSEFRFHIKTVFFTECHQVTRTVGGNLKKIVQQIRVGSDGQIMLVKLSQRLRKER